ncbi:MAG: hypothetical protein M1348_02350 [Candidatus Parvarchaeota archaeon]|nr:hypothetical protein [Candidatus Parvarchaeota archaeon]MCL5101427.1 hypothetical protein [Candidatus Parvarchaeota archaeon]
MKIKSAIGNKVLNSNSNFTIQVKVETEDGFFRGSSPAGESNSKYEVLQFRGDLDSEIREFNTFLSGLKNRDINEIQDIYGVEKLIPERFVGGPSLSLSYALLYALSASLRVEPYSFFGKKSPVVPVSKILGGGVHAGNLGMDIQEILVMTLDDNIKESVASTLAVYKELKELLKGSTYSFLGGVDPEGGFVTGLDNYESLKLAKKAVEHIIQKTGKDIRLGIDMAASTFYQDGKYVYKKPLYGRKEVSRDEQVDLIKKLSEEFDLYYIEDPVDETLIEDYGKVLSETSALVVGDDVTATKTERLSSAEGNINSVLIKPNQVGLLYKVSEFSVMADKLKFTKIVSHRSEETCIPIISDIAVGTGAKYLKVGINRGERVEKINRLLELQ